jgi:hypothetical protein
MCLAAYAFLTLRAGFILPDFISMKRDIKSKESWSTFTHLPFL